MHSSVYHHRAGFVRNGGLSVLRPGETRCEVAVDSDVTITPQKTGLLWAYANHHWKHFATHMGSVTLEVTRG